MVIFLSKPYAKNICEKKSLQHSTEWVPFRSLVVLTWLHVRFQTLFEQRLQWQISRGRTMTLIICLSLSEEGTSFLSQQTFWHWAGVNNEMYVPEPRCFTCVGWTRSSLMISVTPVSFHSAWYVRMSAVKRRKKTLGYLDVLPPLMCCSFFLFSLTFYVHGPVDVNKNRWRENTTRIGLHERRSVAVKKKKSCSWDSVALVLF